MAVTLEEAVATAEERIGPVDKVATDWGDRWASIRNRRTLKAEEPVCSGQRGAVRPSAGLNCRHGALVHPADAVGMRNPRDGHHHRG